MEFSDPGSRLIVPLHLSTVKNAPELVDELMAADIRWFRIGIDLITAGMAADILSMVQERDGHVLWDGKFNDIPDSVAAATKQVASWGVDLLTAHASAGRESLKAAVDNRGSAKVVAVTVLTTMGSLEAQRIFLRSATVAAGIFAESAADIGCQGVICGPRDLATIAHLRRPLIRVTPLVVPDWADPTPATITPGDAVRGGADYLIIDRPILEPPPQVGSRAEAVKKIIDEIAAVTP
jgi:orotidine-5'-phosphate decarboxylase